ncbi:MAG: heme ABC transporter ATP-binding protein [Pseudomonadota bacterium]
MTLRANDIAFLAGEWVLLSNVDLAVDPGELLVILGPNGAGKSTLVGVLSGELAPSGGAVTLNEHCVRRAGLAWLAERRAVMAQSSTIVFDFTVEEVLRMGWTPNERHGDGHWRRALAAVVEWCDLEGLLERTIASMSGGEQQRVHFARTLLQLWPTLADLDEEDRYLLLDEPTASLDLAHQMMVMETIGRLVRSTRLGVVAVLHDLNLAARFATRIALLAGGRVRNEGAPASVLKPELLSEIYGVTVHVSQLDEPSRLVVTT